MNTTVSTSCGFHAVQNALNHPETVEVLLYDVERNDLRLKELTEQARRSQVQIRATGKKELDKVSAGVRHQGVIIIHTTDLAKSPLPLEEYLTQLERVPLLLVLDGIEDPQNLGTILRVADAAGVDGVIRQTRRAASLGSVAKTSAGALAHVRLVSVVNIARALTQLQSAGIWTVGLEADGDPPYENFDLTLPTALVLGNEGRGLRRLVRDRCDRVASIPMLGCVNSLNVAVAAGVSVYEAVRQRRSVQR